MNAKDIEHYLSLVGEELSAMNVQSPIRLLLIGGGYMLTQIRNRTVTGDVDTMWMYPEIDSGSEIYRLFRAAIRFVADDEGLEPSWLNIDVGDFLRVAGPLPKRKLWKKFGPVHVYLPPKDYILAHKLLASRRKDRDDIRALCAQLGVDTREKAQEVLDKYINRETQDNSGIITKLEDLFG